VHISRDNIATLASDTRQQDFLTRLNELATACRDRYQNAMRALQASA
jgi:hypothetical protein